MNKIKVTVVELPRVDGEDYYYEIDVVHTSDNEPEYITDLNYFCATVFSSFWDSERKPIYLETSLTIDEVSAKINESSQYFIDNLPEILKELSSS